MRLPGIIKKEWKKITNRSSISHSVSLTELKNFLRDCFLFLVDVKSVEDLQECRFFLTTDCFYSMCRKIENGQDVIRPFNSIVIENIQIYGWKEQLIKKEKYTVIAAVISIRNKGDWNVFDYDVQMMRPVNQDPIEGMWISADNDWKIRRFEQKD